MSRQPIGHVADPFDGQRRYDVIYADPPWVYRDRAKAGQRGAGFKYPLLNDRDVAALPVGRIAADDSMLFLWVTWPKLQELLPIVDAWGFRYRTVGFVWVKRARSSGALAWGMGSWTRANTEPCLLATRGRPVRASAGVHQVVEAALGRHSEKPAEVRDRIVQLAGDVPRIELFARQLTPGWDAWGNDVQPITDEPTAVESTHGPPRPGSQAWHALRDRLTEHVAANGAVSRSDLSATLGVSPEITRALLAGLLHDGVLEKLGRARGMRYALRPARESDDSEPQPSSPQQMPLRPRED